MMIIMHSGFGPVNFVVVKVVWFLAFLDKLIIQHKKNQFEPDSVLNQTKNQNFTAL